jgi:hypothetical protein
MTLMRLSFFFNFSYTALLTTENNTRVMASIVLAHDESKSDKRSNIAAA